ncbi:FKBP-type peptidyl-prolyl cis-trans isomerase [Aurantiacibacter sp. MUD11]|uniref:FKBP-type peptidyl-prolyl cis-trans isomerase n=1 Tax=Aurantiacibacter sp. MUD11 TaxID=3003265 RepID=UPI0022AA7A50|nr:FKBP-type peptidyl-prolyl cis-trans isomerase [Aurantiacibacter sp. MUD11]WAT18831.1 FKBP-type peptidyl-prolyl cis-trans isomerase [Aurantiacibacter sp. MUD11]
MKKTVLTLAALSLAIPAAAQDESAAPEVGSLAWHNLQQSSLHSLRPEQGWSTLEGGIKFRRTAGEGTGPAPSLRDVVQVNYTGTFFDGSVFDSNEGSAPIEFPLSRLVRGWQIAIPYMGVGDTAEIAIPAELAYGLQGRGPIPGGATLFFTIELVGIPSQGV